MKDNKKKLTIKDDITVLDRQETIITNKETLDAIEESKMLANSPCKLYTDFDEFWKDLFDDET